MKTTELAAQADAIIEVAVASMTAAVAALKAVIEEQSKGLQKADVAQLIGIVAGSDKTGSFRALMNPGGGPGQGAMAGEAANRLRR